MCVLQTFHVFDEYFEHICTHPRFNRDKYRLTGMGVCVMCDVCLCSAYVFVCHVSCVCVMCLVM